MSPVNGVCVVIKVADTSVHSVACKGSICFECALNSEHNKCLRVPYEQLTASTVPISYRISEEKTNIFQRREAMTHSPHCHSVKALHGEDACVFTLHHILVLWL